MADDRPGRPISIELTPGQRGDGPVALAPRRLIADAAYDSDGRRRFLRERGTEPVIPNNPTRKRRHPVDPCAYRDRNAIERMVCRLEDRRRVATRYDRPASNDLAAVLIAAIVSILDISPEPRLLKTGQFSPNG